MFGRPIDKESVQYWGARAIYQGCLTDCQIELLGDRQSSNGKTISSGFTHWLNHRALPWLRNSVKQSCLSISDPQVLSLTEFKYHLEASTNASYGYLYIGAVECPVVPDGHRINKSDAKEERVFFCDGKRVVWGVNWNIPEPGTKGKVVVNGLGNGTVVGYHLSPYAKEFQLLNLQVELDSAPGWWKKQRYDAAVREALKTHVIRGKAKNPDEPEKESLARFKQSYKQPPCITWDCDFRFDT